MNWKITTVAILAMLFSVTGWAGASDDYARGNTLSGDRVLSAGQVRAQIVEDASQLIGGPMASGRVGDLLLYNDRVGFVIAGARPASGINPMGGVVEDAGLLVRGNGESHWINLMGDPSFTLYKKGTDPLTGSRLFAPVSAKVLKDGSDGEAVVRIFGRDAEFPMRKEYLGYASKSLKMKFMVDYILKPGSRVLEMKVTAINEKSGEANLGVGQTYLMGDGAPSFLSGCGFSSTCIDEVKADVFMAAGGGVAYGWFLPGGTINIFMKFDKLLIADAGGFTAPGGGEGSMSSFLAVGSDPADVMKEVYAFRGEDNTGEVSGKCTETGTGTPARGAQVHALDEEGRHFLMADVKDDGTFSLVLPAGKYRLQAVSYDRDDPAPVEISVSKGVAQAVSLEMTAPAVLAYSIKDDAGKFIPATVSFKSAGAEERLVDDPAYYNNRNGNVFYLNHFTGTGVGEVRVRPGKYEVYYSRGLEYEYVKQEIDLKAGETGVAFISLEHSVDTTGYLSGDFHVHASPSQDSDDKLYEKILGIAAVGLEVPIATDHDVRTDYMPTIQQLGMEKIVNTIVGNELTTNRLGHFNAFPLTYDTSKPNNGATAWFDLTVVEIFQAFRDDPIENTVVQLNHPRSMNMGSLSAINYKPETGKASDIKNFSLDFDAIEVLNGGGYEESLRVREDWFSFLNRGKRVTGVGNSDSHDVFSLEVGYPRNFVKSATDEPGEMNIDDFVDSVKALNVSVCGGAFVLMDINGEAVTGETVTDTDGEAELNIKIQAPSWVSADTLTIYGNGEVVAKVEIEKAAGPVMDRKTIKVKAETDTWYVAVVEGEKDLFPVYPGKRTYSFTNPIYLDVDGNGAYNAPQSF